MEPPWNGIVDPDSSIDGACQDYAVCICHTVRSLDIFKFLIGLQQSMKKK
jgi:hypothetical protein